MAFIPNTTCLLYKNIGYNTFGEPKFGRGELTRCAIVKLIGADEKTTVRSDIAASKSHAIDDTVDAKILFKSNCKVERVIRSKSGDIQLLLQKAPSIKHLWQIRPL